MERINHLNFHPIRRWFWRAVAAFKSDLFALLPQVNTRRSFLWLSFLTAIGWAIAVVSVLWVFSR
jgi:hypothetical protein